MVPAPPPAEPPAPVPAPPVAEPPLPDAPLAPETPFDPPFPAPGLPALPAALLEVPPFPETASGSSPEEQPEAPAKPTASTHVVATQESEDASRNSVMGGKVLDG
jgi:hypothetical protein